MDYNEVVKIAPIILACTATISAIAASISAIASFKTAKRTAKSYEYDRIAKRPYFSLKGPGFQPLNPSPPFRLIIPMINVGGRPASDFEFIILMVDSINGNAVLHESKQLANDIDCNSPIPWWNDSIVLPANLPPHYVVVFMKYHDAILQKEFKPEFFMKFNGVINGDFTPDFVQVTKQEIEQIRCLIKKHL